jgi:hypothetical protein
MTISNIGLASILSDPFGKTAKDVMNQVLSPTVFDAADYDKLIHKSAKKKTEQILESIKDCLIKSEQRFKMSEVSNHINYLEQSIIKTDVELFTRIQPFMHIVNHLAQQIPGISQLSAALIISEIGADMSVFPSAKHLVSWAGLAPTNNQSAGKKKSVRISKAGQFLKPLLVQCVLAAVRHNIQPYFAIKFHKIKKRRGHKRAVIAVARMMLTCIYHLIHTGETFNPSDLEQCVNPNPVKKVVLTAQSAIAYLETQGYDISSLVLLQSPDSLSVGVLGEANSA